MNNLRIASFLPAATEMVYALGLEESLVAVTHECDTPARARQKTVVVRPSMEFASLGLSEIDKAVSARAGAGQSLYALDEEALRKLSPNLIVAQDLCQVCAPSGNEATQVLSSLTPKPEILYLTPHTFEEVLIGLITLGEKTGTKLKAEAIADLARLRVEKIASITAKLPLVKVFFMEWVDPIYCGGHWVPEMIQWAGGSDPLAKPGSDSLRVPWEEVVRMNPEILIVSPCGFNAREAANQARLLKSRPGWENLSAVKKKRVFAVDGNSYFARPSPRLAEGVELLAHLFHPELFPWTGPAGAFKKTLTNI